MAAEKILIVDDDPVICELVGMLVERRASSRSWLVTPQVP